LKLFETASTYLQGLQKAKLLKTISNDFKLLQTILKNEDK